MDFTELLKNQKSFIFSIEGIPQSVWVLFRQSDCEFIEARLEILFTQLAFVFGVEYPKSLCYVFGLVT